MTIISINPLPAAQGNYAEAEALYRRSLAITEKGLGQEHDDVVASLNNLAEMFYSQVKLRLSGLFLGNVSKALFEAVADTSVGHLTTKSLLPSQFV